MLMLAEAKTICRTSISAGNEGDEVKKDKLPWDIKQECLWIVRGYDRRVKQYIAKRQDVIEAGGANYVTYVHGDGDKREERRAYMPHTSNTGRPVEDKLAQLEAIEHYPETQKMRAVENAKLMIGADIPSDMLRQQLVQYIILSCNEGKKCPFRYFNIDMSKSDFYRRRDDFLLNIAKFLQMI